MTLKDQLDAVVKSAISDMGEIRAELTELEHAMPGACGRTANIRQIMMTLAARLNGIKVLAAKEVMIGDEEPATKQKGTAGLPLFANAGQNDISERTHALMVASLRRAGDRTLDDDSDADHNVVISDIGKGGGHAL